MNPVAFNILGLEIRWYGLLIAAGMVFGILLSIKTCKWRNIEFEPLLDVVIVCLPFGIIGARLYYVLFRFDHYKDNLIQVFNFRGGGLAVHGGVIFAMVAGYVYTRYKKYDFVGMADVAAPSIILAQAVGRWGNFFNSEVYGMEVTKSFISRFPEFIQRGMFINGNYYNPTFLYESMWNILVCLLLLILLKKSERRGIVIMTYVGVYSLGRYFIENLRTDNLMIGSIRIAQLVSIVGIAAWIGYLIYFKVKKQSVS